MTKEEKDFNPASAVFTPAEVAASGLKAIQEIKDNQSKAVSIGIPGICSNYFAPLLPGQLMAIIAQTSHYKSGTLHYIEHNIANYLALHERTSEAVVHVSVEECLEEQSFLELARESESSEDPGKLARGIFTNWEALQAASYRIAGIPIYRVGDSLTHPEDMPELYLSNIFRSLKYLASEFKIKPAIIGVDYLQALPIDPTNRAVQGEAQRRLQVRDDIFRMRQMGAWFKCPVIVCVQAKQKLEGAPSQNFLLPGNYDGEESSAIGQRADRILSLWMPKQTHTLGSQITHGELTFKVEENLIWVKVGKQRGGLPSGKTWKCRINFQKNIIAPEGEEPETDLGPGIEEASYNVPDTESSFTEIAF